MMIDKMIVIQNNQIAKDIFELKVKGALAAHVREPGQFVHIKVGGFIDAMLRRPISICDVDKQDQVMTMIYRADGNGTKRLSQYAEGEELEILGPLGNGFPIETVKAGSHAILVGGGVGVPPLYYLSKQLKEKGVQATHILGFQTENIVFYEKEFKDLGPTYVTTVDGSKGTKGFVTDVLTEHDFAYDVMYACGPVPMLKALETGYSAKPLYLSLEQRMGCAIGACLACVCKTQDPQDSRGYRKVCSDGPVFKAGEVILPC
ncbi:dihydroorotate dehydrogenase electron transfer subunit [Scopulibacillus cellulosilyticus]|uniref:Dihydroorotate dehydrogenase B (NAD(+)), electron transfer subunit n=1 Tax=Scopulibacillus cellulosilyticus TaxID=2665665 RepID=A0ABW2PXN0_9BACL